MNTEAVHTATRSSVTRSSSHCPSHWQAIVDEVARFPEDVRTLPVAPSTDGPALRAELAARYRFETPVPLDLLTADVMELLRAHTVHVTHPRYFGLFNPSVREAGIVADTLAALYNPQLAVWSHAPAAVELERLALHHLARQLGLDPNAGAATFTTGGAEGNLTAVLAALAAHFPEAARLGVGALPVRPAVYVSAETHHSFVKALRMTGLGTDALRLVSTTAEHALDPIALTTRVREDRRDGWHPLLVVGTAGSTAAGIIDPLPALAAAARDIGAWFHVDAAWGGLAALSPRLRPLLAGIEEADSVTWDAHKGLSVPMGAGMFFSRHVAPLRSAFAVTTSYMPAPHGEGACDGQVFLDPYSTTVQWSRRAIGLKVFMALAELGASGYSALIEHQAAMGELLRERLTAAGWVVVNRTTLPIVCFTHPHIRAGERTAAAVAGVVQENGRAWVSEVVLGEESVVRACVTSYHTNPADVDTLVDELMTALERAETGPATYFREQSAPDRSCNR